MTDIDKRQGDYFEWLLDIVAKRDTIGRSSFRKLLTFLHTVDFRVIVPMDQNRVEDGLTMRYRYATDISNDSVIIQNIIDDLSGPCSVLELMVAIAVRCEEDIMDDPNYGDRTAQWFWGMVTNLGLGAAVDNRFDADRANDIIERFLNRQYEPNGRGGLFRVRNAPRDLREVEIYWQMCWYLNTIT